MYSSWWLTSNRLVASCSTMGILVPAWYLGSLSLGGQIGTGSLTSAWWLSLAEDVVTKAMAPAIIKPNQAILWREDMLSLRSGTWLRVQGVKLDTWHGCSLKPYHFIVSLHVWWVMQVMQRPQKGYKGSLHVSVRSCCVIKKLREASQGRVLIGVSSLVERHYSQSEVLFWIDLRRKFTALITQPHF